MARKTQAASETLDEIQSVADRMAGWIQQNLRLVVGVIGGLLVAAGLVSYGLSFRDSREAAASRALEETRMAYFAAMGAGPGAIEVPELASAEAARRVHDEYVERFQAIADEHPGTLSASMARIEVAQLALDAGDQARALEIYDAILKEDTGGDRLRGMVLQRAAQVLEDLERWDEAATRHEQASKLPDFPLRYWALADAARCRAAAGDADGARALYQRLAEEAPELNLPEHLRAQMRELIASAPS